MEEKYKSIKEMKNQSFMEEKDLSYSSRCYVEKSLKQRFMWSGDWP